MVRLRVPERGRCVSQQLVLRDCFEVEVLLVDGGALASVVEPHFLSFGVLPRFVLFFQVLQRFHQVGEAFLVVLDGDYSKIVYQLSFALCIESFLVYQVGRPWELELTRELTWPAGMLHCDSLPIFLDHGLDRLEPLES